MKIKPVAHYSSLVTRYSSLITRHSSLVTRYSSRPLIFLTIGLTAIGLAFILNLFTVLQPSSVEKYVNKNHIAGMAIVYQETPFTLNFEQQNRIIDAINRSFPYKESKKLDPPSFDKFILYTFHQGPIDIQPIGYLENRLVFSSPKLYGQGYLIENDATMHSLIPNLYDASQQERK